VTTYVEPHRPAPLAAFAVEVGAVVGRRLRHLRRMPGRFIGVTLNPLISMIVLGYLFKKSIIIPGGGSYQEYLFAGAALQVGLAGVGPTAIAVATDLSGGIIDRFRSMPISRAAFLVGHTFADLLVGLLGLVVVTAFGLLLGWRSHAGPLTTLGGFAVMAAFIYVLLWVGVLLGMSSRSAETIDSIAPLIVVVLPFLSSAFLAAANLPSWLAPIAEWNPVSTVSGLCRQLWGNPGATTGSFAAEHPLLISVVFLAVILVVTGSLSLRRYSSTAR
jgi:ABC-2 type transport system permease protein